MIELWFNNIVDAFDARNEIIEAGIFDFDESEEWVYLKHMSHGYRGFGFHDEGTGIMAKLAVGDKTIDISKVDLLSKID